jgi:anti-sigma factor RsiW
MNCPLGTRNQAELLVGYSSGRLDAAAHAAVEQHLETCQECRDFVRQQKAIWQALDLWTPEPISPEFNRRLYQRIDAQTTWRDWMVVPLRPLFSHRGVPLAAAAALLLFAGVMFDRTPMPPKPSPRVGAVAEADGLQPDQVLKALDEMDELSRLNRLLKPDTSEPRM